jgi:two-component system sensor histidine kinase VicK
MESTIADVLKRAFPGLEGDGLTNLVAVASERFYPPNTVIVREEEAGDTFFIVLDGEVEVSKHLDDQTQRVLQRHTSGEFFGEMALIEELPRVATVKTVLPSTLLEISKNDFDAALSRNSTLALTVMRELTKRLRRADQTAITELRQKNEELSCAYHDLAEQERLRSEFLTTVAHELRTPLTSANGFLTLLAGGKLPADRVWGAISRAEENVKRVVKLVNDILFLQEIDLILPEFQPVSVEELVGRVIANWDEQSLEANLSLDVQFERPLPNVMGDPEWLRRAIDAVIDNAVKFSPDGGEIAIRASHQSDQVQLSVTDQGVGIPADQMDLIFTRFRRVEQVGEHLFDGVGIGLPVVRQVLEQHGGTVELYSIEGEGCTVTLNLPAADDGSG